MVGRQASSMFAAPAEIFREGGTIIKVLKHETDL